MLNNYIIYEDNDLLVVNKPTGWVINRSQTWSQDTVQDLVEKVVDFSSIDPESDFRKRSGVVHRLDKETSGILLIAKNEESFINLQRQFKRRTINKEYIALVYGKFKEGRIQIDAPIKRNPRNRMKYAVVAGGKVATTDFKLIKVINWEDEHLSLVTAWPKTGRTHQIRVHLAAFNHPIVSDPVYLGKKRFFRSRKSFPRLMLHAYKISFQHPTLNEDLYFEAPLPTEFSSL